MKKIKFLAIAVMLCTGSYFGYNTYENMTMTEDEKFLMANIEALVEPEHGAGDECPNGGYWSNGQRTEDFKMKRVLIEVSTGKIISILSDDSGDAGAGFKVERLATVAYDCDGTNSNTCLVCNRYVLK